MFDRRTQFAIIAYCRSLSSPLSSGFAAGSIRGIFSHLMREAEQGLCVVVQDLVGVGLGQPEALDIGEGFLVGLVILQYRVVAAGHQMVGAEGFEGADERWLGAVADGVVIEFFGSHTR